jgi:hypothetical protein
MLAVILVLVIATIRVVGTSANNLFSATASSMGQQGLNYNHCSRLDLILLVTPGLETAQFYIRVSVSRIVQTYRVVRDC